MRVNEKGKIVPPINDLEEEFDDDIYQILNKIKDKWKLLQVLLDDEKEKSENPTDKALATLKGQTTAKDIIKKEPDESINYMELTESTIDEMEEKECS